MGKSRSATILLAYLLWASRQSDLSPQGEKNAPDATAADVRVVALLSKPLSVIEALELLRRGRPIAEPNEGFMEQLHLYERMNCPSTDDELQRHKLYRRWMNKRKVEESLRVNQAPEMESIQFEDEDDPEPEAGSNDGEHGQAKDGSISDPSTTAKARMAEKEQHMRPIAPGISAPDGTLASSISPSNPTTVPKLSSNLTTIKCRKCRHNLATTPFIQDHKPPPHRDPNYHLTTEISSTNQSSESTNQCAHIFLHPLSWMRGVLSEGSLEGRLTCPSPKCGTNIGKFAWTGLRCSCGGWVTPGFALIKGKVDEVVTNPSGRGSQPGSGLRLPPGMTHKGNL